MNYAIILLGGASKRFNDPVNKQFKKVLGIPLYQYCLDTFNNSSVIDKIILVVSSSNVGLVKSQIQSFHKVMDVIQGGITRQKSCFEAIKYLSNYALDEDNIFISDAARPLVSLSMIEQLNNELKEYNAVSIAKRVNDTMVNTINFDEVDSYINRAETASIETPQAFKYKTIKKAHDIANINNVFNATDDTTLVKNIDEKIKLVFIEENNFKITTVADLKMFEAILLSKR